MRRHEELPHNAGSRRVTARSAGIAIGARSCGVGTLSRVAIGTLNRAIRTGRSAVAACRISTATTVSATVSASANVPTATVNVDGWGGAYA